MTEYIRSVHMNKKACPLPDYYYVIIQACEALEQKLCNYLVYVGSNSVTVSGTVPSRKHFG